MSTTTVRQTTKWFRRCLKHGRKIDRAYHRARRQLAQAALRQGFDLSQEARLLSTFRLQLTRARARQQAARPKGVAS